MKGKIKKLRGILVLLLLMLLSANSKYIMSMAVESEISVNTENITPTANVVLEKYINYEKDGKKGLLVQYQVSAGTEYKNNETFVPLAATGILINAPKIENSFPESVEVISRSTLLTNGSSDGKDYKTTYTQEKGELQIAAFNKKDENGNYYETYKKDAKDSYTVILNYGENTYNGENLEKELELNGKVVEVLKVKDSPKVEERYENKTTVKENISKLISTKVDSSKIYNGYIKSNAVNGTDYETNYKENVEINVSKKDLGTSKIDLTQKFINNNNEAVETENIIFKSSTLDKQKVLDILGENGYLKILDKDGNTLGELNKDTEVKEDGKYVVNYPENTTKVTLEISNAEKAGYITIQNQKQIKPEEKNTELKQIQEVYNVDEVTSLEIKESQTRVSIVPNLKTWTNEKQNNVEFEVDLYNNSANCNLFKNPVIEIQLPEETRKVILDDATIMHANGLTVKSTKYDEKTRIIRVELEGTQNKYLSEKIEKGTILTIPATIMLEKDIEDKDIDLKVGFKNDNIYTGKTETGTSTTKVALENFNQATVSDEIAPTLTKNLRTLSGAKNAEPTENTSVPTASGITLNVTPVIGDVTRDTVYEGEFIKYEITATNTTGKDIDNVKINAVLPEGVTYGELVREDNEQYVRSYYDFNKQFKTINLGKIKAGKSSNTYFEVQVNDLAEGENTKNITTKIQALIGENLAENKEITHQVNKAEYKVFVSSNAYDPNTFQYRFEIKGNSEEKVKVDIKLPDCITIEMISSDSQAYHTSMEFNSPDKNNVVTMNLKPDKYVIYGKVDRNKIQKTVNSSSTEVKTIVTINDKYKSNEDRVLVQYNAVTISMTSPNEGEKINAGDEIKYDITITNIGKSNIDYSPLNYVKVKLQDYLPVNFEPNKIKYNTYKIDEENKTYQKENKTEELQYSIGDGEGGLRADVNLNFVIPYQESINVEIIGKACMVGEDTVIENNATVTEDVFKWKEGENVYVYDATLEPKTSNTVSHTIIPSVMVRKMAQGQQITDSTSEETQPSNKSDENNQDDNTETEENKKYSIKGYAWNDKNADGKRQKDEEFISSIPTYLINSKGNIVKETITGTDGIYSFEELNKGEYTVVFKYDTNKYTITKCKANGVSESLNSNATKQNASIYGEDVVAGVTDEIALNKDIIDINLGLVENKKFDFKVDNYISKITVKTNDGTKETPYNNATLAKEEIKAKEVEGAIVTVEYKIVVTNNGEIPGKVGRVIDILPEGLSIDNNSTLTWISNPSGGFINTSLSNQVIEPGKSTELTLLATRTMNGNSTGTLTNKVQIDAVSNEFEFDEINLQNNSSKSDLILSISTGLLIYVSIAIILVIVILIILNIKFNIFSNIKLRVLGLVLILFTITFSYANLISNADYYDEDQDHDGEETHKKWFALWNNDSNSEYAYNGGTINSRWRYTTDLTAGNPDIYIFDGDYVTDRDLSSYVVIQRYKGNVQKVGMENGVGPLDFKANPGLLNNMFWSPINFGASSTALSDASDFYGYGVSDGDYEHIFYRVKDYPSLFYVAGDWRTFAEIGEDNIKVNNISGHCLDHGLPVSYDSATRDLYGINYSPDTQKEYIHGGEVNCYPKQEYYWKPTGNIYDDFITGLEQEPEEAIARTYYDRDGDVVDYTTGKYVKPKITYNGDLNQKIKLKDDGSGNCIVGPININKNNIDTRGFKINQWYFTFDGYDGRHGAFTPIKNDGTEITNYNDYEGEFYLKIPIDELRNCGGISQIVVNIKVTYCYWYKEETVGRRIWHNVNGDEFQRVGDDTWETTSIDEKYNNEIDASFYFSNVQGAFTIHKEDEITYKNSAGYDLDVGKALTETGDKISLDGISFVVNKEGSGWLKYDSQGYIDYGDWDEASSIVMKTGENGEAGATRTLIGLEPGQYYIFEIIEAGSVDVGGRIITGSHANDLPDELKNYYKASVDCGLWGCPYSLKLSHNSIVENKDDYDYRYNPVIEQGEFEENTYQTNFYNSRDYVALKIFKQDEYKKNTSLDLTKRPDLSGIQFCLFKEGEGWAHLPYEGAEVTYGNWDDNVYRFTTNSDGETEMLQRLTNDFPYKTARYHLYEVYIPEHLRYYYDLDEEVYTSFGGPSGKVKKVEPNELILRATRWNYGLCTWNKDTKEGRNKTTINERDFLSLQIYKDNEKKEPLNDIGYAILEVGEGSTESNYKGKWITASGIGKFKEKVTSFEYALNNGGRLRTGVVGMQEDGYTCVLNRLPLNGPDGAKGKTYKVFEVDVGKYREVYKLKKFKFDGTEYDGTLVNTFKVSEDGKKITSVDENGNSKTVNLVEAPSRALIKDSTDRNIIHNVYMIGQTNKQFYGSFQLHKQDMLTDAPLKGVGIQIKRKGTAKNTGYIKAKSAGYYTVNGKSVPRYEVEDINASYDEATEFFTDEDGNTPIIYMVPLYEENRKTEIKYEAYETMIPTELKDYFALKADFLQDSINNRQSYGPFYNENALNSALRLLNTDIPGLLKILDDISVSGYDKIHINGNDHDEENSINLWLKTYLNIDYSNEDVALNLGEVKITKDTEPKDNTKTLITNAQKENKQTFIKLSGNVWEDSVNEGVKTETGTNGLRNVGPGEDKDKNIQNIEVKLMKRMDCTKLKNSLTGFRNYPDLQDKNYLDVEVAKTKTDENGYYEFNRVRISDLARYYIEFTYDGITYQSVARTKPGDEGATEEYKIKDGNNTYNIQIPNSKTSKASEDYMLRGKLNDAFGEIVGLGEDGNGQEVTYNGNNVRLDENNYSTKTTEHASTNTRTKEVTLNDIYSRYWKRPTGNSSTVIIDQEAPGKVGRKYDFLLNAKIGTISSSGSNDLLKFYNIMAYGSTTYTNRENNNGNWYCNNKKELLTEIKNLNLGLYRREQPNLTLNKNLYKADISVNGKNYTYKYTMNNEEVKKDEPFSYKVYDDYNLPLYEADVRTSDKNDNTNPFKDDTNKQFKATITYRIALSNLSTNLYTKINSLNDYYTCFRDRGLEIDKDNVNGTEKFAIYISNNPMETNFDNRLEVTEDSYTAIQNESGNNVYRKRNIRLSNGIELPPIHGEGSNTKYLYIRFKILNPNDYCKDVWNGDALTENLENYVEIASYSVFKDKNYSEKYAHIDSTSIPQNLLDKGRLSKDIYQRRHEDDDSRATGLKIIKSTARNITGMVFEDAPVKNFKNNVDVRGTTRDIINREIDRDGDGKIDANEERIGDGVYNKTSNINNMNDLTDKPIKGVKIRLREIDENGNYKATKMWVPNNYGGGSWEEAIIESDENGKFNIENFIPGDYKVEFVWGNGVGVEDAGRFKGTILYNYTKPNHGVSPNKYDSKITYNNNKWYKDENYNQINASVASDDYIRRLAIDQKALGVTEEAYKDNSGNFIKYDKNTSLWEKVTQLNTNEDDYASLDYMHSSTADFRVEVERDTDSGSETNQVKNEESMNNVPNNGFKFDINNIDFGIIERAKQAMGVQKHIKSIKITTAEGRPVVIATIDINGKINAIAGERYLSGGYDLGYIWAQMDKQLQESMKVEIEYEITVGNKSEKDYDDPYYYLYGIADGEQVKLRATYLYDYLGGSQITSDSKEENAWKTDYNPTYIKINDPGDSSKLRKTLTEQAIEEIYTSLKKAGKDATNLNIVNQYIDENYYTENDLDDHGFNSQDAKDTLKEIYKEWVTGESYNGKKHDGVLYNGDNANVMRTIKLTNREIIQGIETINELVKDPYESGDVRTERLKASKLINVGEELDLINDVELATVAVDVKQKTGAKVNYKNSPLFDRAEYATLSPAQGENRDYFGMTMVAISILTLLGSGIILIKRFIKNR